MSLRCSAASVYALLGNLPMDQLPLEVVLPLYNMVVQKRLNDLKISTNNWFTQYVDRTVTGEEIHLGIDNFGTPVQVQVEVSGIVQPYWKPMQIVSFEGLQDWRETGKLVCAFRGQGADAYLKLDRNYLLPSRVRIWYEPESQMVDGYGSEVPIPVNFIEFINMEVAMLCAPHAQDLTPEQAQRMSALIPLYGAQVTEMRKQWEVLTNSQFEHRAYAKRRFDRRRFGGN